MGVVDDLEPPPEAKAVEVGEVDRAKEGLLSAWMAQCWAVDTHPERFQNTSLRLQVEHARLAGPGCDPRTPVNEASDIVLKAS